MVDRLVNSESNSRRIARVENCFGSFGQPLSIPGRVLVGEGVLIKMCRRKPKPRQVFLFNDILVYGSIVISRKKFTRQHIIQLEEVSLKDLDDDDVDLKYGWLIMTPSKSFAVYAANESEKHQWMMHMTNCIDERLTLTGKPRAKTHAAVWVPDSDATHCMVCKKTHFTVINRRHHCRACGVVVCGHCSRNRILIPTQSEKPVRVCDLCYSRNSRPSARTFIRPAPPPRAVPLTSNSNHNASPVNVDNNDSNPADPARGGGVSDGGADGDQRDTQPTVVTSGETADENPLADNTTVGEVDVEKLDRTGDTSDDSDQDDDPENTRVIEDIESLGLDDQKPTFYNEGDCEPRNGDTTHDKRQSSESGSSQEVTASSPSQSTSTTTSPTNDLSLPPPKENGNNKTAVEEKAEDKPTTPTDR